MSRFSYSLEERDLSTIPETEIISAAETGYMISQKGTKLVRITSSAVLKTGYDVCQQGADNMDYILRNSHGHIRVPRVYRYFNLGGLGYLVTEYIDGTSLDRIP